MRTIQNLVTLAGLSLALLALGVTGARGQIELSSTHFAGTFTLPFNAQWGTMNLPAGDYTLRYGPLPAGPALVEVAGKEEGSPHGMILAGPADPTSSGEGENVLICLRNGGNGGIVRELRMAEAGEYVTFPTPHGVKVKSKVIAEHQNKSGNAQAVLVAIRIHPLPVK